MIRSNSASHYRPSILPAHGHDIRNTAYCTKITEKISIPISLIGVDNTSLRNTTILEKYTPFIRTGNLVGTVYKLGTHIILRPCNIENVVFPIMLENLCAFGRYARCTSSHCGRTVDNDLINTPLPDSRSVGGQLNDAYIPRSVELIDPSVLIDAQRLLVQH